MAVEAALILSVVLLPLVLGVITFGMYFWKAQAAQPLAAQLPLQSIVGQFNCAQLVERVKTTVQNALPGVTGLSDGTVSLDDITVSAIKAVPTIGADVTVSIRLPGVSTLGGLLPVPNGGDLVSEASYRLDNVELSTAGC